MSHREFFAILVVFSLIGYSCAEDTSIVRNQFKEWYPEFRLLFSTLINGTCAPLYNTYLHADRSSVPIDYLSGGSSKSRLAQPVVNCILSGTAEIVKTNMSSAQVLLGLTPTILAGLGPSVEDVATLAIVGRRPLLAFLIAVGSPAINPISSSGPEMTDLRKKEDVTDAAVVLNDTQGRLRISGKILGGRRMLYLEYAIVIASISILGWTVYELAKRTVPNFAPQINYLPFLWTFIMISAHPFGVYALHTRVALTTCRQKLPLRSYLSLKNQFRPFRDQQQPSITLKPETFKFVLSSWFVKLLIVINLIFGTLAWSSLLFISVRDSLTVIARYMCCQFMSRAVLMIELATLRDATFDESDGKRPASDESYELNRTDTLASYNSDASKPGFRNIEQLKSLV